MSSRLAMDNILNILSYIENNKNILNISLLNKEIYQLYKYKLFKVNNCFKISRVLKYKFKNNRILLRCLHSCDCWHVTKRLCNSCKNSRMWYIQQNHF